jgi:DNA invertase Pin-like site-specific DNA recombinase
LQLEGCEKVFAEQVSSAARVRPQLDLALKFVRRGDVLVAVKADRIARSVADLLWITKDLAARGIGLRLVGETGTELDTRSSVAKPMLTMLSLIADFEREVMAQRQRERTINAATLRRYKRGEPIAQTLSRDALCLAAEGMAKPAIAEKLGVSLSTVYRIVRSEGSNQQT